VIVYDVESRGRAHMSELLEQ